MKQRVNRTARAGFTLVEVLVTLVLIALLVGVVLPAVIGQLGTGENTRLQQDMEAVRSAGKMFRIDVKRWPSSLDQLVLQPDNWADSTDINGVNIPGGLLARWSGPYLETGSITSATDSLHSGGGAAIRPGLRKLTLESAEYWAMIVANVDTLRIQAMGLEIDGSENLETGRIRMFDVGNDPADTLMQYHASPIN